MLDHQVGEKIWTRRTTNDEVISKWEIKVEIWAYLPLDHLWQPPDISNATAVTACFEQRKVWELTWWKNIWKHNGKQRSSKWGTCTKTATKKVKHQENQWWNLARYWFYITKKSFRLPKTRKGRKSYFMSSPSDSLKRVCCWFWSVKSVSSNCTITLFDCHQNETRFSL